MITRKINVPFSGFYYSIWDNESLCEEERNYNHYCEDEGLPMIDWEKSRFNNTAYESAVMGMYVPEIVENIAFALGINIKFKSASEWSPREYNFATDKFDAVCEFDDDVYDRLRDLMHRHEEPLRKKIKRNHTSCDGFWSFMSNNLDDWYELIADNEELYLDYILRYLVEVERGSDFFDELECFLFGDFWGNNSITDFYDELVYMNGFALCPAV